MASLLLAGLLLSVSLRVSKSIAAYSIGHDITWIPAIGLLGMALIGPFLLLYVRNHLKINVLSNRDLFHFILPAAILIALVLNNLVVFSYLYWISSLQLIGYLGVSWKIAMDKIGRKHWIYTLLSLLTGIVFTFLFQLSVPSLPNYIIATTIASGFLHAGLYLGYKNRKVILSGLAKNEISEDQQEIIDQLVYLLDKEKVYRDLEVNRAKLAARLNIKPYVLSNAVNTCFNKSIPELLNEYRLEAVKKSLKEERHHKIEVLALENGFKSPTIFYRTFKNYTQLSPTEYRDQALQK